MYLATRNDNMPTAVWIWDMSRLELCATLLQIEHVRALAWDPHHHRLAVVTGKGTRARSHHTHSLTHVLESKFLIEVYVFIFKSGVYQRVVNDTKAVDSWHVEATRRLTRGVN